MKTEFASTTDSVSRYLAVFVKRNTSDALVPNILSRSGKAWFAFIAKTQDDESQNQELLCGRVFIFTLEDLWKDSRTWIEEFQRHLLNFDASSKSSLSAHIGDRYSILLDKLRPPSSYFSDVEICRTGRTTVLPPSDVSLSDFAQLLIKNSELYIKEELSKQIFYFLKDIGHRHQHHNARTDTITDLYDARGDDITWRNNTLYNMYRNIIEMKRNPHKATFNDCLGIVAYASTFRKICKVELKKNKDPSLQNSVSLPKFYEKELERSIKATQAKQERDTTIRELQSETTRNLILSVLGITLSMTTLLALSNSLPLKVTPSWEIVYVATFALNSPIKFLIAVTIMVYIGRYLRNKDLNDASTLTLYFMRMVQWFPKWLVLSFLTVVFLASALAFALYPIRH